MNMDIWHIYVGASRPLDGAARAGSERFVKHDDHTAALTASEARLRQAEADRDAYDEVIASTREVLAAFPAEHPAQMARLALEQLDAAKAQRIRDIEEKAWLSVEFYKAKGLLKQCSSWVLASDAPLYVTDALSAFLTTPPSSEAVTDDEPCTQCKGTGWDSMRERDCDCVGPSSEAGT